MSKCVVLRSFANFGKNEGFWTIAVGRAPVAVGDVVDDWLKQDRFVLWDGQGYCYSLRLPGAGRMADRDDIVSSWYTHGMHLPA